MKVDSRNSIAMRLQPQPGLYLSSALLRRALVQSLFLTGFRPLAASTDSSRL